MKEDKYYTILISDNLNHEANENYKGTVYY